MIIDARNLSSLPAEEWLAARRHVFVDGVEIEKVWYVDTDAGFVRTYDVLGDGAPAHLVRDLVASGRLDPSWEQTDGDYPIAYKTIYGEIELRKVEDGEERGPR